MKMVFKFITVIALFAGVGAVAHAKQADDLIGAWCFYEQEAGGNKVPEKVDISFGGNGSYVWTEGVFQQKGRWKIQEQKLEMTQIGSHHIVSLDNASMVLVRMSTMRFSKGKCSDAASSQLDTTQFHNAASTGDLSAMRQSIANGMDVNIVDLNRKDTALIKAAKFCQITAVRLLIENGADRTIKNDDGQTAAQYAKASPFHKGCDGVIELLK